MADDIVKVKVSELPSASKIDNFLAFGVETSTNRSVKVPMALLRGNQGDIGATGPTGATGAKGDKGEKGDTGPANKLAIGTVSSGATAGATISGTAPNQTLNLTLPKGEKGDTGNQGIQGIQGAKGDTGATGAKGDKGDTGATGPANKLAIGTVSSGATAGATITGTAPNQTLNLTLPKGEKGDTGSQGIQGAKGDTGAKGDKGDSGATGPANKLAIGTVSSGVTAGATITGTAPNQTLNLTLPKGEKGDTGNQGIQGIQGAKGDTGATGAKGDKGDTGAIGPANKLAIGTVSSGATAGATITGTAPNQTLNLTLPKGEKGDTGNQGIQGIQGIQGAKGDTGATGAKGDKGDTGATGPTNKLSIGTVSSGATAGATITGTAPNQTLNLTLPKGEKGDTGNQGVQGIQGAKGDKGDTGVGLPVGGSAGQQLVKKSATDYDYEWQTPEGAGDMLKSIYDPQNKATNVFGYVDDKVKTDVPVGAKFTDTVYTHPTTAGNKHIPAGGAANQILRYSAAGTAVWSNENNTTYEEISESEINTGTATDLRSVTGRRIKFILDKVQGWINALTKSDVGLGNVDNIQQASKTEFNTHNTDSTRHITSAERTAWNSKWNYSENTIKAVKVSNADNADTVGGKTVAENVPPGAKFTDTVYTHPTTAGNKHIPAGGAANQILRYSAAGTAVWSNENNTTYEEISESEINTGTATDLRSVTGRRIKFILDKVQGWINALTKSDVGLGNVDNIQQASKAEFNTHNTDSTRHITSAERTAWNAKGSSSLALGETSATAYRGDRGKTAYDHSQAAHAPSNAQKNSDITKAEIEAKLIGTITSHTHAYVGTSGNETVAGTKTFSTIPVLPASNPTTDNQAVRKKYIDDKVKTDVPVGAKFTDTTYSKATTSADGLMSKEDKSKLDGLKFEVVASLPASPDPNTFYFIPE